MHKTINENLQKAVSAIDKDGSQTLTKLAFHAAVRSSNQVRDRLVFLNLDKVEDLFDKIDCDGSGS